jgi:hypothetical protein
LSDNFIECAAQRNCNSYAEFLSPKKPQDDRGDGLSGSVPGNRKGGRRESKSRIGKPVFHIEYTAESMRGGPVKRSTDKSEVSKSRQCLEGDKLGALMSTTIKALNLDGWVQFCDGKTANTTLARGLIVKGLGKECSKK